MEEITVGDLVGWKEFVGQVFGIVEKVEEERALVCIPSKGTGWVNLDKLYIQHEEMGF